MICQKTRDLLQDKQIAMRLAQQIQAVMLVIAKLPGAPNTSTMPAYIFNILTHKHIQIRYDIPKDNDTELTV